MKVLRVKFSKRKEHKRWLQDDYLGLGGLELYQNWKPFESLGRRSDTRLVQEQERAAALEWDIEEVEEEGSNVYNVSGKSKMRKAKPQRKKQ